MVILFFKSFLLLLKSNTPVDIARNFSQREIYIQINRTDISYKVFKNFSPCYSCEKDTYYSLRGNIPRIVLSFSPTYRLVSFQQQPETHFTISVTGSQAFRLTLITITLPLRGLWFADFRSCTSQALYVLEPISYNTYINAIRYQHFLLVQFHFSGEPRRNILLSQIFTEFSSYGFILYIYLFGLSKVSWLMVSL